MRESFIVEIKAGFDAAHALANYQGKCENLHGHRFNVVARFQSQACQEIGFGLDFNEAKQALDQSLSVLDHTFLNDLPIFHKTNPTAENIAKYLFQRLREYAEQNQCQLVSIRVSEGEDFSVEYVQEP